MPWYCNQNDFPASCASNQTATQTHRTDKAAIKAANDASRALGDD